MAGPAAEISAATDPGGDEYTTSSISPSNQVMVELMMLIHYTAEIEARLKFNFLAKRDFITFYAIFRELSLKVAHIIDEETIDTINNDYFGKMPLLNTDTERFEWAAKGLELAVALKDAMVDAGFMRFFDTPNDPPFIQPFFTDDFSAFTFDGLNDDLNARRPTKEV